MGSPPRSSTFPLPNDFFAFDTMSLERIVQYQRFIESYLDETIHLCDNVGTVKWETMKQKDGVSISRATLKESGELAVRGICQVSASFDEMKGALVTPNTEIFRQMENAINGNEFLDGIVVKVLPMIDRMSNAFASIKWHAIKSIAPTIAAHRDYIYVELVDEYIDPSGNRVGFRLSKSISMQEIPSLQHSHQLIRGETHSICRFKVVPGEEGIQLDIMSRTDLKGSLPLWIASKIAESAAFRAGNIRHWMDLKRLSMLRFALKSDWVPASMRKFCIICSRIFSVFRNKHHCRSCGEVICSQCSIHKVVPVNKVGNIRVRLCLKCNFEARKADLPTLREISSSMNFSFVRASICSSSSSDRDTKSSMDFRDFEGSSMKLNTKLRISYDHTVTNSFRSLPPTVTRNTSGSPNSVANAAVLDLQLDAIVSSCSTPVDRQPRRESSSFNRLVSSIPPPDPKFLANLDSDSFDIIQRSDAIDVESKGNEIMEKLGTINEQLNQTDRDLNVVARASSILTIQEQLRRTDKEIGQMTRGWIRESSNTNDSHLVGHDDDDFVNQKSFQSVGGKSMEESAAGNVIRNSRQNTTMNPPFSMSSNKTTSIPPPPPPPPPVRNSSSSLVPLVDGISADLDDIGNYLHGRENDDIERNISPTIPKEIEMSGNRTMSNIFQMLAKQHHEKYFDEDSEEIVDDSYLPFGWKSVFSKATGEVYFYNESCGITQWTVPDWNTENQALEYAVL